MSAADGATTILLVEDEPDVLDSLAALIEDAVEDVQVIRAADAQQARRRLQGGTLVVAIADYRLPGQDGASLLDELGSAHPGVRRILMSAYPEIGNVPDAVADVFVQKPMDPDAFVKVVQTLVDSARAQADVILEPIPRRRPSAP